MVHLGAALTCVAAIASADILYAATVAFVSRRAPLRYGVTVYAALAAYTFYRYAPVAIQSRPLAAALSILAYMHVFQVLDDLCITRVTWAEYRAFVVAGQGKKSDGDARRLATAEPSSWSRFCWGLAMSHNMRGVQTPWAIRGVAPKSSAPVTITRSAFLREHLLKFAGLYVLIDSFAYFPPPEAHLVAVGKRNFVTAWRHGHLTAEDVVVRFVSSFFLAVNTSSIAQICYSLAALVVVGTGLQTPDMWPGLWGHLRAARTLRGFWGSLWHQVMRRNLEPVTATMAHDVFRLAPGGTLTRRVRFFLAFLIPGLCHMPMDTTVGIPARHSPALRMWLVCPLGIALETTVQRLARAAGLKPSERVRTIVGCTWTVLFMVWCAPWWSYAQLAEFRYGHDEIVPFSVIGYVAGLGKA